VSPSASFRGAEKHRNSTDYSSESKKQKTEEKEITARYVSSFTFALGEASLPCFLSAAILPFDYYQPILEHRRKKYVFAFTALASCSPVCVQVHARGYVRGWSLHLAASRRFGYFMLLLFL
jgi:hypothetical protein